MTPPTTFIDALNSERATLAAATKRGIGMPIAGMLFWLAMAWLLRAYEPHRAMPLAFFLTGAVFPLGAALTRFARGDLFFKSPGLTPLGMQLAALQLFFWPIIILIWRLAPEWTPWTMAILFGSHFLGYYWLYGSKAYAFLSVSVAVSLTVLAAVTRSAMPTVVPLITAGCYAISVVLLWRENRQRWRSHLGQRHDEQLQIL